MEGLESMTPLESEKKDLMARLGEIYYKKCKESGNVTAEEAEILEKIARLDQEMPGEDTEYQGSVCPGCGAPVEPDQVFCVNCGIRLVEDDAVTEMHLENDMPKPGNVCPHCGAPVNDDQDFCIMCGTRLEAADRPSRKLRMFRSGVPAAERSFRRRCIFAQPAEPGWIDK